MTDDRQMDETQSEQTEATEDANFGDLKVEGGGAGLGVDAAGAAAGAELDDSNDEGAAEMKALDEEDGEADVTASGAE